MLRPAQREHGVTLIELMIGIAIVAVLLGLGVPGFQTFIENSHIRNAGDAIQNGLNLAKAEAVRRNTNVRFVLGAGSSWTVVCATAVADADSDGIPECPGSAPTATTPAYIQSRSAADGSAKASIDTQEVNAATGVAVSSPVFTNMLSFNGKGEVTNLPLGSSAVFNVSNPSGGACVADGGNMRCLRVAVTSFGDVRMCDPARSAGDPQAC